MAALVADRVRDTSTTTGTGALTLSGSPPAGYRTFSSIPGIAVNDTFRVLIHNQDVPSEWEVSNVTYSAANQITRTTVESSSNAGAAVNFSAGTKRVMLIHSSVQIKDPIFDSVSITDTTASTSTITGALVVAGGVGIGGSLSAGALNSYGAGAGLFISDRGGSNHWTYYVNTTFNFYSTGAAADVIKIDYTGAMQLLSTTVSSSVATGALTVAGGVGVAGAMYVGGGIFNTLNAHYAYVGGTGAGFWLASITTGADRWFFGSDAVSADTFRIYSALSAANLLVVTANTTPSDSLMTIVGGLAVGTINGATLDNNAWSSSTPTITAGSGTFTTVSSVCRYKTIGKSVLWNMEITVTTNGSAATFMRSTNMPFTALNDNYVSGYCPETGKGVAGVIAAGTTIMTIFNTDGTFPTDGANARTVNIGGVVEI